MSTESGRTVLALICTNAAVFCMWRVALRRPAWEDKMYRHFTTSGEGIRSGRFHTLFTASISHQGYLHVGMNMLVLYNLGPSVCTAIKRER